MLTLVTIASGFRSSVTHTCPGIHRQTESFIFRAKKHFLVKDISLCAPTCERLYKRKAEDEQAQPEKRTGCELHIVCAARGIATKQWTILFDVNDRDAQRRKWSWSVLKIDLFQTQHGLMKFAKTGWRIAKRAKPAQRRNLEMFDTRCKNRRQRYAESPFKPLNLVMNQSSIGRSFLDSFPARRSASAGTRHVDLTFCATRPNHNKSIIEFEKQQPSNNGQDRLPQRDSSSNETETSRVPGHVPVPGHRVTPRSSVLATHVCNGATYHPVTAHERHNFASIGFRGPDFVRPPRKSDLHDCFFGFERHQRMIGISSKQSAAETVANYSGGR